MWHVHITCWIPKATNTYSHYKVLITFRLQQMLQGGSNMTGTDLCVNKPHCAAAVRP